MYQIELKDIPLSLSVSVSNMELIKPQDCCISIRNLIIKGNISEKYPNLLIAFGLRGTYVPPDLASMWGRPSGAYYTKSMFLYNPNDPTYHIIDPTVAIDQNQESIPLGYYVAAIMNHTEYLSALTHDKDYDLNLNTDFYEKMKSLLNWAKENNIRVYEPK